MLEINALVMIETYYQWSQTWGLWVISGGYKYRYEHSSTIAQIISVLTRCLLYKVWEYWICIEMPGGICGHKKTGNRWSVWGWSTHWSVN